MFRHRNGLSPKNHDRPQLRLEELESRTLLSGNNPIHALTPGGQSSALPDRAGHIINQTYDGFSSGAVAQVFGDFPNSSTYEFDDFTTTQDFFVNGFIVPGVELGSRFFNTAVTGEIWSNLPDLGGQVVMSGSGFEGRGGTLNIIFGNQTLPAGTYYITAFVTRNFNPGGQWYWDRTTPVSGSEEFFYNPGGDFGFGTSSIPGSVVFGSAGDMAFQLNGTAVSNLVSLPTNPIKSVGGEAQNNIIRGQGLGVDLRVLDAAFVSSSQGKTQDSQPLMARHINNGSLDGSVGLDLTHGIFPGELN